MSRTLRATGSGGIDFDSFLSSNAATGEIRTTHDARVLILTAETLLALADAVRDRLGDAVGEVMYGAGHAWGRQRFAEFAAEAEEGDAVLYHMRNMGLDEFKERFNDQLVRGGWGTFAIEERFEVVVVHVSNSAFHEMVSSKDRRYADFFAGFLAGFFSELIGVTLDAAQIAGFDEPREPCVFVLADEKIVAPVRAWLGGGKGTEEILALLEAKEYEKTPPKAQN